MSLGRDADALVDHRDLDLVALGAGRDDHARAAVGVGDGVGDEVADRGADLLLRPEDLQAGSPRDSTVICLAAASMALVSTAVATAASRSTMTGLLERVVALQPGQLDDLLHELGEPVALGEHPPGEALDGLRVVGGVVDGLGEQPDRADRGLELVADVGDEVAAHGLHAALAGAVLDERQHQPGAERRDARGQRAGRARRRSRAGRCSLSRICPSRRTCATRSSSSGSDDGVAAHQPEGVRRRRGLEDVVGLVDDDRAGAQDAEDGRDAGLDDGRLGRGERCGAGGR